MARRKPLSRLRGKGSLRRRPGQRPPRSITLVVCEGDTEREYFAAVRDRYRLTTAEVELPKNTAGSAPISVVQYAEERSAEPGGYDKVFCVFDRNGHQSFDEARDRIRALASRRRGSLPIEEAISIPCFEIWILLHFAQSDAPFDRCDDVIQEIRHGHMPTYTKADRRVASQLMASLEMACANAEWVEQRAPNNNHNPFTTVHRVVRHFSTVAAEAVSA